MQAPSVCGVGARGQEEYKESERSLAASTAASCNDFFWSEGSEQVCMFKGNCNGRDRGTHRVRWYGWKMRQKFENMPNLYEIWE